MLKKIEKKNIPIMPPDLTLWLALNSSNYPCFEHMFMVSKVFERLKFYCITLYVSSTQKKHYVNVDSSYALTSRSFNVICLLVKSLYLKVEDGRFF